MHRTTLAATIAAGILLGATAAAANIVPGPEIYSVEQFGQNVAIEITTQGAGLESHVMEAAVEVLRYHGEETEVITGPKQFSEAEVARTESLCSEIYGPNLGQCADTPELCDDCDDDGDLECYGRCVDVHWITVVDACAEPGFTGYQLVVYSGFADTGWEDDEEPYADRIWPVSIEDSGDSCLDEGDTQCATTAAGRPTGASPALLFLLMLAVGLLAARRG